MGAGRILIKGGRVVEPSLCDEPFAADVLSGGGRILRIIPRPDGSMPASVAEASDPKEYAEACDEVLDATGCFVLPGGVDPHTHFELVAGGLHVADDFATASLAALCGGTTSVVEHPGFGPEGCGLFHQMDVYRNLTRGRSYVDYGLHLVFQPPGPDQTIGGEAAWRALASIPEAVERGYVSGKAYTTYNGMLDDRLLLRLMAAMGEAGCLLTVHCENDAATAWKRAHNAYGPNDPRAHPASRPALCEMEAVTRILALAEAAEVPVYIVHVSTAGATEAIRRAKGRGRPVFAETCPQYLLLTDECYAEKDGLRYVMAPPLRNREDGRVLWQALTDGGIDVVATDHCAYSLGQKRERGADCVFSCPGGIPGVETRLPLLFTHGVATGRLTWKRFVEVTARNPARIFGLSRKGTLVEGMDADILVLDPAQEKPLTPESLCHPCDYSPFDNLPNPLGRHTVKTAAGWPRHVLLRGEIVLRDRLPVSDLPHGEYIRRLP